jgi:CRISPR-associated endonuclease Cas1
MINSQPDFPDTYRRVRRAAESKSLLVVDGFGVSMNVERGHLIVKDGFIAEGETREVHFPRGRCEIDRIIVRASAGTVTIGALDWCNRMGITVAFVGSDSRLINCLIPDGAHDGPLRRAQAISGTTDDGLRLARWLLRKKLEAQRDGIVATNKPAIEEMNATIRAVERDETLTELLTREAYGGRIYWDSFQGTELPWIGAAQKRVPTHWRMISARDSGGRNRVRDARDPFSALRNYGFTLLAVETRVACMAESLDPDLGYLHVDERLRESFVFDLLEPLRSRVDFLSLEWARKRGLRPWMFIELRDGIVRLDPDTARDYAHFLMPQLRGPARRTAAEFASQLRRVTIPYRLIDHRVARKRETSKDSVRNPCEYCKQPVPKPGFKFCGRVCYLRHSVEIRQPLKLAQARLADLRREGHNPGWSPEARQKREAWAAANIRRKASPLTADERRERKSRQDKATEEKRRLVLGLTAEEWLARKAARMREYRRRRAAENGAGTRTS